MLCAGHTHRQPGSYRPQPSSRGGRGHDRRHISQPSRDSRCERHYSNDIAAVGKDYRCGYNKSHADVAQPEEQRFRKPQVKGSSPFIGSTFARRQTAIHPSTALSGSSCREGRNRAPRNEAWLIVRASSGTMGDRCMCFDPCRRLGWKPAHGYIRNHGGNIRWHLSKD